MLVSIGYIISNKLLPYTTQLLWWKQSQGCIFWATLIHIMLMKKVNRADTHRGKQARQASVPALKWTVKATVQRQSFKSIMKKMFECHSQVVNHSPSPQVVQCKVLVNTKLSNLNKALFWVGVVRVKSKEMWNFSDFLTTQLKAPCQQTHPNRQHDVTDYQESCPSFGSPILLS